MSWNRWEIPYISNCTSRLNRTSTSCVTASEAARYFRWAIVREPVSKFESGVRQIWFQEGPESPNAQLSADELLDKQLRRKVGSWINEHAQSNTWRLTGRTRGVGARALPLSFVGKIEHLAADWPAVVDEIVRRSNRPQLRAALLRPLHHGNQRSTMTNERTGKSSVLSAAAIRRMCASRHYGGEWVAFDYPMPAACRNVTDAPPR